MNDEYERDIEALGGQGDLIGTSKCGKLEAYRQGVGVEDVEKRVKRSRLQRERENNFRDVDAGFKERWGGGDPSLPVCEKEEPGVGPFMLKRACELRKLV